MLLTQSMLTRPLGALLLLGAAAQAGVLNVPVGGPIQPVIDAAAPGDTVVIPSGTYFETLLIAAGKDGLTLKGAGKVVLDACPGEPQGTGITVRAAGVTLGNLTVRHARSTEGPPAGHHDYGDGINAQDADDLRLDRVEVFGCMSAPMWLTGDRITLENCTVVATGEFAVRITGAQARVRGFDVRAMGVTGLEILGEDGLVEKSRLRSVAGSGLRVTGKGNVVRKCQITVSGLGDLEGTAGLEASGDEIVLTRNTIRGGAMGLSVFGYGARIEDNVLSGYGFAGIYADSFGSPTLDAPAVIEGNRLTGGERGVLVGGWEGVQITHNALADCQAGIYFGEMDTSDALVADNVLTRCGGGAWAAIEADAGGTIVGNVLKFPLGTAIRVSESKCTVMDNVVTHGRLHGVTVAERLTAIEVSGNVLTDLGGDGVQTRSFATLVAGNKIAKVRAPFTASLLEGATFQDEGGNVPSLPGAPGDVPDIEIED